MSHPHPAKPEEEVRSAIPKRRKGSKNKYTVIIKCKLCEPRKDPRMLSLLLPVVAQPMMEKMSAKFVRRNYYALISLTGIEIEEY